MPILQPRDRQEVQRRFDTQLKSDVSLTLYTQPESPLFIPGRECRSCGPTQRLLEEVAELSSKLHVNVVDFYQNLDDAGRLDIGKIPAILLGAEESRVRYYGLPSGFEFAVLLDAVIAASDKRSTLQLETRRSLKELTEDVHIQVFVTPN